MANKKRYYFVEVNIPDAVKTAHPDKDPSSIMRDLLLAWKDATGTKYAKALFDFIYEDVKSYGWHPTETNKMAYCLTFINARHFENYQAVSYTHLRAHETSLHLVCRLLLEKKKK